MNTLKTNVTKTQAFSLIELMVVIAIVALLSAVAVPAYKEYMGKSRMAEVNGFIGQQLNLWVEKHALGTTASTATDESPYITSIVHNSTGVVVTMVQSNTIAESFNAAPVVVTYTASDADAAGGNNVIDWSCVVTTPASGANHTDIVTHYFNKCT